MKVQALVDSIREIGLLEPIGLTREKRLVYGRHRLEAFRQLELTTIPAVILDLDDLRIELAEIDENLQRKQLSKLVSCGVLELTFCTSPFHYR